MVIMTQASDTTMTIRITVPNMIPGMPYNNKAGFPFVTSGLVTGVVSLLVTPRLVLGIGLPLGTPRFVIGIVLLLVNAWLVTGIWLVLVNAGLVTGMKLLSVNAGLVVEGVRVDGSFIEAWMLIVADPMAEVIGIVEEGHVKPFVSLPVQCTKNVVIYGELSWRFVS